MMQMKPPMLQKYKVGRQPLAIVSDHRSLTYWCHYCITSLNRLWAGQASSVFVFGSLSASCNTGLGPSFLENVPLNMLGEYRPLLVMFISKLVSGNYYVLYY
jgi:hypothetical protein